MTAPGTGTVYKAIVTGRNYNCLENLALDMLRLDLGMLRLDMEMQHIETGIGWVI